MPAIEVATIAVFERDASGVEAAPMGLCLDHSDNLVVADVKSHSIRVISAADGSVSTLAGCGKAGFADGVGRQAFFNAPQSVAVDASGDVIVADFGNKALRRVRDDGEVSTLRLNGSLDGPRDLCIDADDNIIVADGLCIRRISPAGDVTLVAGRPEVGDPVAATFNLAPHICMGSGGQRLFVGDNTQIRTIDLAKGVAGTTVATLCNVSNHTRSLCVDGDGTLIVCTGYNIYKDSNAGPLNLLAGAVQQGFRDGTSPVFNHITGMCIDEQGDIIVTDSGNRRVRKVKNTGLRAPPTDLPSTFDACRRKMLEDMKWSNVRFNVVARVNGKEQQKEVRAHAAVLCATSEYFRAMLEGDFSEAVDVNAAKVVTIQNTTPSAFEAIIRHIYTDDLDHIIDDDLVAVLCKAKEIELHRVYNYTCRRLRKTIRPDNCISFFLQAHDFDELELKELAGRYIPTNVTKTMAEAPHTLDLFSDRPGGMLAGVLQGGKSNLPAHTGA